MIMGQAIRHGRTVRPVREGRAPGTGDATDEPGAAAARPIGQIERLH